MMILRASRSELGIVLTYIHLERSGGQVGRSVSRCTVRALHSTAAVSTVGGIWQGRLPAANRIEDDGPSAALRSCVASTMSGGPTLAAGALGERVLVQQVSVKSEVSFCVSI